MKNDFESYESIYWKAFGAFLGGVIVFVLIVCVVGLMMSLTDCRVMLPHCDDLKKKNQDGVCLKYKADNE